jgi:hypothetical protein
MLNIFKESIFLRKSSSIIFFLFSFLSASHAQNSDVESGALSLFQETCGFDQIHSSNLNNPIYNQEWVGHNAMMLKEISNARAKAGTVQIPVVVHVLHKGETIGVGANISDAQILSAINNLNAVYANTMGTRSSVDMGVKFQLATMDPNYNPTNGIVRVNASTVPDYSRDGMQLGGVGLGADEIALKNLSKWPTDKYLNFWIVSEIRGNNGKYGAQGFADIPVAITPHNGVVMMAGSFGYDPTGALGYFFGPLGGNNAVTVHEVGHFLDLYHTFQGGVDGICPPTETNCSTENDFVCDTPPHMHYMTSNPTLYASCQSGHVNECAKGNMDQVIHNIMNYTSCPDRFTAGQKARVTACLATSRSGLVTSLGLTSPNRLLVASGSGSIAKGVGLKGYSSMISKIVFNDIRVESRSASAILNNSLRMRVISDTMSVSGPCFTSTDGQIKDYSAIIKSSVASATFLASDAENDFMIYPNPTQGNVTIKGSFATDATMLVVDQAGRAVASSRSLSDETSIDLSRVQKGMYSVIITNKGSKTMKSITVN